MVLEEPMPLSSVLNPSKSAYFPSLTKIVGTLGPKSHSVEEIEACILAGMSVARFDFSSKNAEYHQEAIDNLRTATKKANKLCAVMLDTMGPEIQICNKNEKSIELTAGDCVTVTPDLSKAPSAEVLPINYSELALAVNMGDTIFVGQYLFTGSETTSVWLEVLETNGQDVICLVKNSTVLTGFIFTVHVSQVHINLPTLTNTDKQIISTWGLQNNVDIISLSYTRSAKDVQELRAFLQIHNHQECLIYAKVETVEGLEHFDEILQEADGIILSRGNLGIDLPPEKVFLFQKYAVNRCNMAGKPAIITRVVDTMTDNLRPTRAEATDVANAVLDGTDSISLGAETFRGLYPVETIKTVGRICAEAENVYNYSFHFKRIVEHVKETASYEECAAASAVRSANTVRAAAIVVFTSSGRAARLIAKYRAPMPVLAVVIPRTSSGATQAAQCLSLRGVYPILADASMASEAVSREESGVKLALNYGRSIGIIKNVDRVVIFEKIGDSPVIKIIDCQDED